MYIEFRLPPLTPLLQIPPVVLDDDDGGGGGDV